MLTSKTNNLVEEINEVKRLCMEQFTSEMMENVDDKDFVLYIKMLRVLNISTEVMLEKAKMIDEINKKLDRLLKKVES